LLGESVYYTLEQRKILVTGPLCDSLDAMRIRVAIQGQQASFHDIAAHHLLGADIELVYCDTFDATFAALAKDKADKVVVALENSLYGSINQTYDLLLKHSFWISGELYLHVNQCLIGLPDTHLPDIKEVHSQIMALAQCEAFLDKQLPYAKRIEQHDTTASVQAIKTWNDPQKVAIASAEAAKLHGLKILAAEIEDHKHNYTRFVLLGKETVVNSAANKTSLVLTTDHKPGALYHALGIFAKGNMNLTKLQSRPIMGKAWHYMFYLDVDAAAESPEFKIVLEKLHNQGCEVTILGSYEAGRQT